MLKEEDTIPHKYPVGTKVEITYPWPEDAPDDVKDLDPLFMPGIKGTITAYVVRLDSKGKQGSNYTIPPTYALSPHTTTMFGMCSIWEWLEEVQTHMRNGTSPGSTNPVIWQHMALLKMSQLRIEGDVGEDLIDYFLSKAS